MPRALLACDWTYGLNDRAAFASRVGEQATFCWRLERVGAAEGATLIGYEAFADADAWSPAGARSSYVALHASPGMSLSLHSADCMPRSGGDQMQSSPILWRQPRHNELLSALCSYACLL